MVKTTYIQVFLLESGCSCFQTPELTFNLQDYWLYKSQSTKNKHSVHNAFARVQEYMNPILTIIFHFDRT